MGKISEETTWSIQIETQWKPNTKEEDEWNTNVHGWKIWKKIVDLLYTHNKTTYEGTNVDAVISQLVLQQSVKEPTYILGNSSIFIDLIFTSHLILLME